MTTDRHEKYGWIYFDGLSAFNGFWFWDIAGRLGWNYTSSLLHPFIYNHNRGDWLFAYPGLNNWYHSYAANASIQIGSTSNPYVADLVKEAEEGRIFGDFLVVEDPDASAGRYVLTERGALSTPLKDSCQLYFTVKEAGFYQIKARVRAPNNNAGSLYVKVDNLPDGDGFLWQLPITDVFVDNYVPGGDNPDPLSFDLNPGQVVVEFLLHKEGCQLDKVELVKQ